MRLSKVHHSIAYENIQDRRARTMVVCGPGGVLHDYVPFYFAPRSPMLYTINHGNVPNCPDGQGRVLHLVAGAQAVQTSGAGFVFTNGHAIIAMSDQFDDLAALAEVDWEVMKSTYWHDTAEEPDRKRRRQAEFLVHDFVPYALIEEIAVCTQQVADEVRAIVRNNPHQPEVAVHRDWYY